jgi:hypothetical protein
LNIRIEYSYKKIVITALETQGVFAVGTKKTEVATVRESEIIEGLINNKD